MKDHLTNTTVREMCSPKCFDDLHNLSGVPYVLDTSQTFQHFLEEVMLGTVSCLCTQGSPFRSSPQNYHPNSKQSRGIALPQEIPEQDKEIYHRSLARLT